MALVARRPITDTLSYNATSNVAYEIPRRAIQTYPDVERVNPGDTVRAYLTFMSPEMHAGKICAGTIFLLREGHKTVGYGRVTQVLELEQSSQRIREEASRP